MGTDSPPPPPSRRSGGVLLHPTSLPGPYGVGDLGPAAHAWVEALARAGQSWWQVLPLGPPGFGDSPYQSYSAFAGNESLLSPELLARDGLLEPAELHAPPFPADWVDYPTVAPYKEAMVRRAWERFRGGAARPLRDEFDRFRAAEAGWLDDYALYAALKDAHGGEGWKQWPRPLLAREPAALAAAKREHADAAGRHAFGQFLFFRQWDALRRHAQALGVKLIGDVPIFVSPDSADVWSRPELFLLDKARNQTVVAGVPPDYFSADGQLWGNPLYDWSAHKREGYRWWAARLRAVRRQVDLVRLGALRGAAAPLQRPGRLGDRPHRPMGAWPGRRLPEVAARPARRAAADRRGPGPDHRRRAGLAGAVRPAGDAGVAVRLRRRPGQPVPAAQPHEE